MLKKIISHFQKQKETKPVQNKNVKKNSNTLMNRLKEIATDQEMSLLVQLENTDWQSIKEILLISPSLHERYIRKYYSSYEYYKDIDSIPNDFDTNYYFQSELLPKLKEIESIILLEKTTNKKILVEFYPVINLPSNIEFDEIAFMGSSLYNHFYQTQFEISGKELYSFKDLLQYIETMGINDFHIKAIAENQYIRTARIGAKIVRLDENISFEKVIDEHLHEAKLMMNKDTIEEPPEMTGLIKINLINKKGTPIERTFRINIVITAKGLKKTKSISVRRLMNLEEISSLGLTGLGYTERSIELIEKIKQKTYGINVIAGKTNSGKTTLLTAIMNDFDKKLVRVISIENPTEIVTGYDQIDLSLTESADAKFKMTRQRASKALLRHDPDVVLITELRDEEVSDFVQLGLRGHSAYSTIHAGDVKTTILRLLSGTDNPVDVIESLNGILAQSLVAKVCPVCKGEGQDCKHCMGTGFKGVVPIVEIAYFKKMNVSNYINEETGKINFKTFFDFPSLIKNGSMEYISKEEVAKEYYDKGMITKDDYEQFRL